MVKTQKVKQELDERRDSVLLLRYRTTSPKKDAVKYCSYGVIAKIVSLTYNQVQHICVHALAKAGKRPKALDISRKLDEIHVEYLTSHKTLELWSGMTIAERCKFFHRKFSNKKIAPTSLRRFYQKHKIKRKKVRQDKFLPAHLVAGYAQECQNKLNEIGQAMVEDRLMIYLDEVNFTKLSIQNRDWSAKNSNLSVDQKDIYTGYRSVIASMNEERGLEHYVIYNSAINSERFIAFLKGLRRSFGRRPLALFMDQLKVHWATDVMPYYQSLNITPIFNIGYSPQFNPIEAVFSKVKFNFCRKRLKCLVNKTGFNADREIEISLLSVTTAHCTACMRKSLHLLERASQEN